MPLKQYIYISIIGIFTFTTGFVYLAYGIQKQKEVHINNEPFHFPLIHDTTNYQTFKRVAKSMSTANYEILYIGKWTDTIIPDYTLKYFPILLLPQSKSKKKYDPYDTTGHYKRLIEHKMHPYYRSFYSIIRSDKYTHRQNTPLTITVDPSQSIKNDDRLVNREEPFFDAYPVLIENISQDTISIGYGHFLPIILEAKDSTDTWKPVERNWTYGCGVGVGVFILPPKEMILSATTNYHGNYQTTLRLKIEDNISNEFKGSINYSQFKSSQTRIN